MGQNTDKFNKAIERLREKASSQAEQSPLCGIAEQAEEKESWRKRAQDYCCNMMNYHWDGGGNIGGHLWYGFLELFLKRESFIPSFR